MYFRRFAKSGRSLAAFAHDVVMAAASFLLALGLRLGADLEAYLRDPETWVAVGIFTLVCAGVFWFTGLYRGIWRYASIQDIMNIVRAVTLAILIFLPLSFLATRLEAVPRSVLIIDWLLLIVLLGAPRMAYRVLKDRGIQHLFEMTRAFRVPVLLVGAGDGADLFIRHTTRDPDSPYEVVGIIDEKGSRVGRKIRGVPVLENLPTLDHAVRALARRGQAPQRLVITRELDRDQLSDLLEKADAHGMILTRLPQLTDFQAGRGGIAQSTDPRPVAVEDLLRRPQAQLDRTSMARLLQGRVVLVTGAGGSIGGELARQAAGFEPRRLLLLDHSEYLLYQIDQEIAELAPHVDRRALLVDVRDKTAIAQVFDAEVPEIVLHAAALKHVPMAEGNPLAAILTNVIGTRNVADCCRRLGAEAMVQISTDKAVNPSSVMGATKRLAECYIQACDLAARGGEAAQNRDHKGARTRFVTVRFGNVLGSTGSVVPLFQKQIARGGPVTVTDPQMTRYFMTIAEAVQLVLQASALGMVGEEDEVGKIYVLNMGEPVQIIELARQMIRLAGLKPDKDIEIAVTGLRPGEKLHEELFHPGETLLPTSHPSLQLSKTRTTSPDLLDKQLESLERFAWDGEAEKAIALLTRLVPEYAQEQEAAAVIDLKGVRDRSSS